MIRFFQWMLLISLIVTSSLVNAVAANQDDTLEIAVALLQSKSFNEKVKAIEVLETNGGEQAKILLNALLDNRVFYIKKDKRLVVGGSQDKEYSVSDALTGEALGTLHRGQLQKSR